MQPDAVPRLDFSRRATTPELMDIEDCDYETFRACLIDLARVNRLSLAYRPTLAFLDALAASGRLPGNRPLRVLDAGSGYGDMLRRIAVWGRERGVALQLQGVDLNPFSARAAREATPAGTPVEWSTSDVFDAADEPVDVIVSSLFTHHLDDRVLARFLATMEDKAALGWFVNDLHRHPVPYWFFTGASRALRFHRFVRSDGPISITRAFTAADWRRLLVEAKIEPGAATIRWWMPFRLCVSRLKPG